MFRPLGIVYPQSILENNSILTTTFEIGGGHIFRTPTVCLSVSVCGRFHASSLPSGYHLDDGEEPGHGGDEPGTIWATFVN